MRIEANLVDIPNKTIYPAAITICDKTIAHIQRIDKKLSTYILPGFIDAHIHIESSMLTPSRFASLAASHGIVATISDPHEIANVLGIEGIEFMIEDGKRGGLKHFFGAPSCVPATPFETSGATLGPKEVARLLEQKDIYFLSEVMNFPAVIANEPQTIAKIEAAKALGKPIDGHAPKVLGEALQRYIDAGITTDHEATTLDEAKEKLQRGMKILIRQGSAAKNFDALHPLIPNHYQDVMFCSDDLHPNDLVKGSIDLLVRKSIDLGYDLFKVLQIACLNPITHYNIPVGRLQIGDLADFIIVKDLHSFQCIATYIDGKPFAPSHHTITPINRFNAKLSSFITPPPCQNYRLIEAFDGSLLTGSSIHQGSYPKKDINMLVVLNRYHPAPPQTAPIKGFALQKGAIAASVAHDAHNLIAVGATVQDITRALALLIEHKGGLCAVDGQEELFLPLPVAGLMSYEDGYKVAQKYEALDRFAKERLGSPFYAPFMTLSFMALAVIPKLKLTDRGLVDVERFCFTSMCAQEE